MSVNTHRLEYYVQQAGYQLPAQVLKRDGTLATFDVNRIAAAVERCFSQLESRPKIEAEAVAESVARAVSVRSNGSIPHVEEIQDAVEFALLSSGEFEAAKHYILFRQQRSQERKDRDVPASVKAAFEEDRKYFPTVAQQTTFYDKYSRYNYDLGRRETWPETVERVVGHLRWEVEQHKPGAISDAVFDRIQDAILNMKIMPSMRLLAMAGPAAERNSMALYNCFAASEKYITDRGLASFGETVGTKQRVLNGDGKWVDAEIREFGVQRLQEITFRPGSRSRTKLRHRVQATKNHRWITKRGETTDIQVGDEVAFVGATPRRFVLDAWIAGFGYGDGTVTKTGNAQIRLCGEKDQRWLSRFEEYGHFRRYDMPSYQGDPLLIFERGHFSDWKTLPTHVSDPDWLASWLEGYMDADGDRSYTVQYGRKLYSQNEDAIQFAKSIAPLAGYMVVGETVGSNMETNYGPRSAPGRTLVLRDSGGFFRVTGIEDLEVEEPVYCAVVPEGHDFVLENGIHTGNCSYMPVKDIQSFVEAMLISMAGCGVGFSVEREYVEQFPRVKRQRKKQDVPVHVIEDTTEGWGEAIRVGLEAWWDGRDVEFDASLIRPAGFPLRTKGGRASGPEPLLKALQKLREVVLSRQGSFIRTTDAHIMMCAVGDAAVQGGVRRTAMISLFDWDDHEMRNVKSGPNMDPLLWNANNSAVWPEDISDVDIIQQMLDMVKTKSGEPGIFSRSNALRTKPKRRKAARFGTNPCGEIMLRPFGFCNLSQAVARPGDTAEDLREKVELATIVGVIQALSTRFPGLRDEWKKNAEEERLLGVDLTAQADCELTRKGAEDGDKLRDELSVFSLEVATEYAELLGVNVPAAISCNKPAGNSTEFLGAASNGIHDPHSPFFVRRMTFGTHTPLFKVLKNEGVPMEPKYGTTAETATQWIAEFPKRAPEGTLTKSDVSVIDQLEFWLLNKEHWTEHNPSCTINYREDEVMDMISWVVKHKDRIGGLSFFPVADAVYAQAPFEAIDEDEYNRRVAEFPEVDFSKIYRYELEDMTTAAQELACFAGSCEV